MSKKNIEIEVKKIISKCFNFEIKNINNATTSKDIKKWDSIGQIRLILMVENKFKIKVNQKKYGELFSLKSFVDYISRFK
jgi:acyl carrier protein|tara:strand:+ start:278 stop:517 length:240 start_codon:yes stop_codon:yes gene_type:complete